MEATIRFDEDDFEGFQSFSDVKSKLNTNASEFIPKHFKDLSTEKSLTCVAFSDIHEAPIHDVMGYIGKYKGKDVCIIAGDLTDGGRKRVENDPLVSLNYMMTFFSLLYTHRYFKYILYIGGNHEHVMNYPDLFTKFMSFVCTIPNFYILDIFTPANLGIQTLFPQRFREKVTIQGFVFSGISATIGVINNEQRTRRFNVHTKGELKQLLSQYDGNDVDVLITHQNPSPTFHPLCGNNIVDDKLCEILKHGNLLANIHGHRHESSCMGFYMCEKCFLMINASYSEQNKRVLRQTHPFKLVNDSKGKYICLE
jgi:hypothetical protein